MGASPAVGCSVWLAEHKASYSRIWLWLRRAALFIVQRNCQLVAPPEPTIGSSGHQASAGLHKLPDHSADPQTGRLAAAKRGPNCIVLDWIRERTWQVAKQFAGSIREAWASSCLLDHDHL